jgi:hypothetical protein
VDQRVGVAAVTREPLIITYTNLLHQYRDPNATEVLAFVQQHEGDPVFLGRVKTLNKVFKLKEALVQT